MVNESDGATVVWRRNIDEAGHRRAMKRFYAWYAGPVSALVLAVAVFSGIGNAAGVLILLGSVGLLLFFWIWATGRNRRTNPQVTFDGQHLAWARRRVPVAEVVGFTTFQTTTTINISADSRGTAHLGEVRFEMADGSREEFTWADLSDDDLDALRHALEPLMPGRWHPVDAPLNTTER